MHLKAWKLNSSYQRSRVTTVLLSSFWSSECLSVQWANTQVGKSLRPKFSWILQWVMSLDSLTDHSIHMDQLPHGTIRLLKYQKNPTESIHISQAKFMAMENEWIKGSGLCPSYPSPCSSQTLIKWVNLNHHPLRLFFLNIYLLEDLIWSTNIIALIKKAQQWLYLWGCWRKLICQNSCWWPSLAAPRAAS